MTAQQQRRAMTPEEFAAWSYNEWALKPGPDGAPLQPYAALSPGLQGLLTRTVAEARMEERRQSLNALAFVHMAMLRHLLSGTGHENMAADAAQELSDMLIAALSEPAPTPTLTMIP